MHSKPLIVLPTYNERDNLAPLISEIWRHLPEAHILVVDDNSPDGTGDLADTLSRKDDRVHVVHRKNKEGLGKAYIHGFREAVAMKPWRIVQMDSDFSHPPEEIPQMLELSRDADLVLGCRYHKDGGIDGWGLHRLILSRGGNIYSQIILGLPYKDLTGGFKVWAPDTLDRVISQKILCDGYAFQVEFVARAHKLGAKIKEHPFTFKERRSGASKMSGNIITEAVINILRIRRELARS